MAPAPAHAAAQQPSVDLTSASRSAISLPLTSNNQLSSSMDLDSAGVFVVTATGKHAAAHEEKESASSSTAVDIRGGGDDDEGKSGDTMTDGMTPTQQLFYAAEKGDRALIRSAITRGADVKVHDMGPKVQAEEKQRLEEAAGNKRSKKQAEAEEKEQETMFRDIPVTEDTALHKAAEKGHTDAVELLFYAEADIEGKNRLGSTPLHRAVSAKQQEVVALLLKHGARLDATNAIGNTALHIASYQGDLEMAQLLVTHGKHEAYRLVVAVNQAGVTPIDYARKKQMHTLLCSYRLLSSATSSFIRYPLLDHPVDGTPKNSRMLIPHLSGNGDTAPQLSRPGSWGKPLPGEEGKQTPSGQREEHGRLGELHSVHHHAPNPPISGHHSITHSSHPVEQHGPSSNHHAPSISSRPLPANEQQDSSSHANNTIKPTAPIAAADSTPAAATTLPPLQAANSLPSSTFSTFAAQSDSPASHSLHTPKQAQAATAGGDSSLPTKPSFEKTSSLDSHPLDSERRQGSMSAVGQIVSPVLAVRGMEGTAAGSFSMHAGARGVSMGGLSLNMLPNECEPRDEEEKRE